MTTIHITKHALSMGIYTVNNALRCESDEYRFMVRHCFYYLNNDCFFDYNDAVTKAKEMQAKEIKRMERRIKKISELKFN